ncbi:hypothetical protein FRC03_004897, partial [Tulasnella sp. 419]
MALPVDLGFLTGVWLGTFLYGIYTVLFWLCVFKFFRRGGNGWIITITMVLLYTSSTIHIALALRSEISYFIEQSGQSFGALKALSRCCTPLQTARGAILIINVMIADALMIWRLYIVWERNILVCIPTIITFCGYVAFGIVTVHFSYKGPFYNRPTLIHWWSNVCNMAMTMTTTIWVTSLISFRLWKHRRLMAGALPARSLKFYHLVLMLMIESGVLYTVSWAAFLIVFCVGSPGQLLLMLQIMPQIVGISPTLILYQLQSGHKSTSVVTESNTLP